MSTESAVDVCISCFSVPVLKSRDQGQLKEEFTLGSAAGERSSPCWRSRGRAQKCEVEHSVGVACGFEMSEPVPSDVSQS